MGKRGSYRCAVCGHEWMSSKEPSRCAEPKCRSRKWQFGSGQEVVITETPVVGRKTHRSESGPRTAVVMKPRSAGVSDLVVGVGDTCAVPVAEVEIPANGKSRYEQWVESKKKPVDPDRDPTLPPEDEPEPQSELPVWIETPFKPGRPKGWMCREHKTTTCGICEPMNEWLERMNRGN